jgi:hypothetical protein
VCQERLTIGVKHIRQHVTQQKIVWANKIIVTTIKFAESCLQTIVGKPWSVSLLLPCKRCETNREVPTMPANETVETTVTLACLTVDYFELQIDRMSNKLLHTKSYARYIHHIMLIVHYVIVVLNPASKQASQPAKKKRC